MLTATARSLSPAKNSPRMGSHEFDRRDLPTVSKVKTLLVQMHDVMRLKHYRVERGLIGVALI
jgi:hypothetical protein